MRAGLVAVQGCREIFRRTDGDESREEREGSEGGKWIEGWGTEVRAALVIVARLLVNANLNGKA